MLPFFFEASKQLIKACKCIIARDTESPGAVLGGHVGHRTESGQLTHVLYPSIHPAKGKEEHKTGRTTRKVSYIDYRGETIHQGYLSLCGVIDVVP